MGAWSFFTRHNSFPGNWRVEHYLFLRSSWYFSISTWPSLMTREDSHVEKIRTEGTIKPCKGKLRSTWLWLLNKWRGVFLSFSESCLVYEKRKLSFFAPFLLSSVESCLLWRSEALGMRLGRRRESLLWRQDLQISTFIRKKWINLNSNTWLNEVSAVE